MWDSNWSLNPKCTLTRNEQGSRSYQIGTRNASTFLRLADGETQILGGLITDEERNTADKLPGPGHLPWIGRLFGSTSTNKSRTEIVLAITPRVIRSFAEMDHARSSIFSGTAMVLRDRQILAEPVTRVSLPGAVLNSTATPNANPAGSATAVAPEGAVRGSLPTVQYPLTSPSIAPQTAPSLPPPPPMIKR